MMGALMSTAFLKPVITPEENVFHPKPTMAKMITTNNMNPNNPIQYVL